jgi:hypothetical protein
MLLKGKISNWKSRKTSDVLHVFAQLALPVILYLLVKSDFFAIAFALIVLSKWRIFSVKIRHWATNIASNAVDIIMSVSYISMLRYYDGVIINLAMFLLMIFWVFVLKPGQGPLSISVQGLAVQFIAPTAVFLNLSSKSTLVLCILVGLVNYFAANHILGGYGDPLRLSISYVWAMFGVTLVYILSKWLIFYGFIAQPVVILSLIAYALSGYNYIKHQSTRYQYYKRYVVGLLVVSLLIVIVLTDWSHKLV